MSSLRDLVGRRVLVTHDAGTEPATVTGVIDSADYPAVYVTYGDRTTGRVNPEQITEQGEPHA